MIRQFVALLLALTLGFAPHPAFSALKAVQTVGPPAAVSITGGNIAYEVALSAVPVTGAADANENTFATIALPALTANALLVIESVWTFTSSANLKTLKYKIGATAITTITGTTGTPNRIVTNAQNINATNSQSLDVWNNSASAIAFSTTTSAVDVSGATSLTITGQKATAGETLTLVRYRVSLRNGA